MPIDVTQLPALERELVYANHTDPSGREPNPGRIKAIEEQIQLVKTALRAKELTGGKVETADAKPAKAAERADVPTAEKTVEPTVEKEKAA